MFTLNPTVDTGKDSTIVTPRVAPADVNQNPEVFDERGSAQCKRDKSENLINMRAEIGEAKLGELLKDVYTDLPTNLMPPGI